MSDSNPFGDSSSSDEDDDFFSSYKTKTNFHKKENTLSDDEEDESESSPPKRARKGGVMSATDDALSKLEHRRERNKQLKAFKAQQQDNDDEDSDVEVLVEQVAAAGASTKNNNKDESVVDMLDSSDEDEKAPSFYSHSQTPVVVMQRSGVAKGTCDKITQARNARFKLEQAQRYHAEDCYVPVPPQVEPVVLTVNDGPTAVVQKQKDYGPPLQVKMRSTEIINGKRMETTTTETMTIRQLEPFQKLLERYQIKHSIVTAESSIKFSLDGQRIDLLQTPKFYELEDDDIVEVLVTTLRSSSSHASTSTPKPTAASTAHLGPTLQLNMRTQEQGGSKLTSDFMSIRMNEPLQKLMDKYKKHKKLAAAATVIFKFDGETMQLHRTPRSYDMEDEDMVDVVCK